MPTGGVSALVTDESAAGTANSQQGQQGEHGQKLLVIYVALMLALLLSALDQTIVSTASWPGRRA